MFVFKSCSIKFSSPNPTGAFRSGEILSGELRLELLKEIKIQKILMTVKGKAKVIWTISRSKNTRVFQGKEVLYRVEAAVLQNTGSWYDEPTLQPGVHVYPFRCQPPTGNFPSTFEGKHGRIVYSVVFEIHRQDHIKTIDSDFKFERLVNVAVPELLMPQSETKRRSLSCFCCTVSGDIYLDVFVEKKGFIPGETINITAEVGNGTSKNIVLIATLSKIVTYYTVGKADKKACPKELGYVTGQPIQPNTSAFECELAVPIPEDLNISLGNCEVLEVEYSLVVNLFVKGCPAMKVVFPIVIGNCRQQPELPEANC
ncbi:arrestin domain-containing protein 3-like [Engraulis encrasicolus]|uniref:arrestin domain-containing protein 3-like n=1 Tax=Engraulis encrasicolus TaxID=184585 RepID=UPI002FD5EB70